MNSHPKLRVVLVAPRIAINVGAIARTVHALSGELHLVGPLGFQLDPVKIKRASVGFWEDLNPQIYKDFLSFWQAFPRTSKTEFFFATKHAKSHYFDQCYGEDVVLIFGNEETGVHESFWDFKGLPSIVSCRIPMNAVRCINLSVSVGIMGFEVLRQWVSQDQFALSEFDQAIYQQAQASKEVGPCV